MSNNRNRGGCGCGCLYLTGMPLAVICSWVLNHSLLWAIFHALIWWAYIPYLCLGYGGGFPWGSL